MTPTITPLMVVSACLMGAISAYLAFRREKNPYMWFLIGAFFGVFGIFAFFLAPNNKKTTQVPKTPTLKLCGPTDKFWYYIDTNNAQQGPMSYDAIKTAWKEGKIDLSTYIWHEDLNDWKRLKENIEIER